MGKIMINTVTALFAMAAFGFQWGYQQADDGSMEYILQLSPQEARHLATSPGVEITSYVPDEARPVGQIRIVVGEGALPRQAQPPDGQSDPESALALNDSSGRPITETQSRVARERSAAEPAEGANRYGGRRDLDQDVAGRLVAIPAEPESTRVAQRQEVTPPASQSGSPLDTESDGPSAAGDAAGTPGEPAATIPAERRQRELPDGITPPVYTTDSPQPAKAAIDLPALGSLRSNEQPAEREVSPSDRPDDREEALLTQSPPMDADGDRPWLPLVGAIAVACGFLAGNVFQWRSYLSLRKRYLHLLRKTGG